MVVVVASGGHTAMLNGRSPAPIAEVIASVHKAMGSRAEKVVYIGAGVDASYGDFIELVDGLWPEAEVLSVLTSRVKALVRENNCIDHSCRDCNGLRRLSNRTR
jgi:hypothetical protein